MVDASHYPQQWKSIFRQSAPVYRQGATTAHLMHLRRMQNKNMPAADMFQTIALAWCPILSIYPSIATRNSGFACHFNISFQDTKVCPPDFPLCNEARSSSGPAAPANSSRPSSAWPKLNWVIKCIQSVNLRCKQDGPAQLSPVRLLLKITPRGHKS